MVELILHIGDGKCGSTSIHASLFDAHDLLLENKILYLAPERLVGHSYYLSLMGNDIGGDIREQKYLAKENIKNINIALRKFEPKHLIISSELFFYFDVQRLWSFLTDALEADITATHVTAYVRCPASRYLSGMQQRLARYRAIIPPGKFKRDTAEALLLWSQFTKNGSISIGLFDRKFLKGGSVVADFCSIVSSISGKNELILPEAIENTSLSAEQSIVLQNFRTDFLSHVDGKFVEQCNRLIGFFRDIGPYVDELSTKLILSDAARDLVNYNNASVIKKMDEYLPFLNMGHRCNNDSHLNIERSFIYKYLEKIDEYFPRLNMVEWCDRRAMAGVGSSTPWPSDKIESVLDTYDRDLVGHLRQLLPCYNTGLRDGLNDEADRALSHIGRSDKLLRLYGEYLASESCRKAASQVADLTAPTVG
jgi:hypothetical protein